MDIPRPEKRAFRILFHRRLKYNVLRRLPCIITISCGCEIQMAQYDQKTCVQRAIAIIALESTQIFFS